MARVALLGVPVDVMQFGEAVQNVLAWLDEPDTAHTAHFCNVHLIVTAHDTPRVFENLERGDLNATDGMPLVWLARALGVRGERVSGPDLMVAVLDRGRARHARHYLYGGGPGVPEALAARLTERYPGLEVVGSWSPPFTTPTADERRSDIERIAAARPDYVWVGLGAPKQEAWVEAAREELAVSGILAVGAAFDFHSGKRRRAPGWMQRAGLEWFFRLVNEPHRLWRRYAITNTRFLMLAGRQVVLRALASRR